MTAMGLAGQLNLGQILSAQSAVAQSSVSRVEQEHLTALERDGLRGPLKTCVEDTPIYQGRSVTTKDYGLDGKLLSFRTEIEGQPSSSFSASDWLESDVTDSQGRLLKKVYGRRGEPTRETVYSYDDEGRVQTVTSEYSRFEFHYPAGGKISVQTFGPKTREGTRGTIFAGSAWHAAQVGFGVPMCGNVMMIYDSDDRPTEMQVRNADGQIVTRIFRTYDAEGRITEERIEKKMSSVDRMTPEQRAQLTPDQAKGYALVTNPVGTAFTYDSQGRITKKRERNIFFEETTTISYNEQGDTARERKTIKKNSVLPMPDYMLQDSDIRYDYQYDSYGNWTERTETRADGSSEYTRRVLTYC